MTIKSRFILISAFIFLSKNAFAAIPLIGVDADGSEVETIIDNNALNGILDDFYDSGIKSLNKYELKNDKWKLERFALGASLKSKVGIGIINLEVKPSFRLVFKRKAL